MRSLSRLLAVLLALGSIMGLCVPAFAEEYGAQTGTVTIENARDGDTYKLYLLASKKGDRYLPVDGWDLTFDGVKVLYDGTEITEANVVDTASKLLKASEEKSADHTASGSEGKAEFANVQYGYYLVDYGNGMSGLFELNAETMVLEMKRDTPPEDPNIVKKIKLANGDLVDWTTVDDGDVVEFEVEVVLPSLEELNKDRYSGWYNFSIEDQVSDGFVQNRNVKATLDDKEVDLAADPAASGNARKFGQFNDTDDESIIVEYDNAKHFAVKFGDKTGEQNTVSAASFLKRHAGKTLKLNYSATVINRAIQMPEEYNRVTYWYGNNPPESDVVFVFDFTIIIDKYDSADQSRPLLGAEFVLQNDKGCFYCCDRKSDNSNHAGDGVQWIETEFDPETGDFVVPKGIDRGAMVRTTTNKESKARTHFEGIAIGTYKLYEIKAPEGYARKKEPIEIEIFVSGTKETKVEVPKPDNKMETVIKEIKEFSYRIDGGEPTVIKSGESLWGSGWDQLLISTGIGNTRSGTLLPSTGGMGTTLFYIGGGALVIGAASFILFRKRGK